MKNLPSGCRIIGAWATMTLIVGLFLIPLGLVVGFFVGAPTMLLFGGIALVLAIVIGLLFTLYYRKLDADSSDGHDK